MALIVVHCSLAPQGRLAVTSVRQA